MAEDRVVDIRLSNLTKRFEGVVAVDDLSLDRAGAVLRPPRAPGANGVSPGDRVTAGWSPDCTFVVDTLECL